MNFKVGDTVEYGGQIGKVIRINIDAQFPVAVVIGDILIFSFTKHGYFYGHKNLRHYGHITLLKLADDN